MRRWWSRGSEEPDQAATVPIRQRGGNVQVCLIRRRGTLAWGIPKGHIDAGDTAVEAALAEAREEAGLVGRIDGSVVGTYTYSKWEGRLTVAVFVMHVTEVLSVWDEMDIRERRWATLDEAGRLLEQHAVSPLWKTVRAIAVGSAVHRGPEEP